MSRPVAGLFLQDLGKIAPLDGQMGVPEPRFVPEGLAGALFGQIAPDLADLSSFGRAENVPQLRTYAILDGAKLPFVLTGLLEASGLSYCSLWQGDMQEQMGDYAPYLVELTEDAPLTRDLMTGPEGSGGLWDRDLALYVRSRSDLTTVRQHLRHYTKVRRKGGDWSNLRFWEPALGLGMFAGPAQAGTESAAATLAGAYFPDRLTASSAIFIANGRCGILPCPPGLPPRPADWMFEAPHEAVVKAARVRADLLEIAGLVVRQSGTRSPVSSHDLQGHLARVGAEYHAIGFRKRAHIATLLTWEALLGPDFMNRFQSGAPRQIIYKSTSADEAFDRLTAFLKEIDE